MSKNAYTDRFLDIVFNIIKPSSKKDFAESIGLDKSKFRNLEIGKNGVTIEALCSFVEVFPQYNTDYILTGRGSMFMENIESSENNEATRINRENQDKILQLHKELESAWMEIGKLRMELNKKTQEVKQRRT